MPPILLAAAMLAWPALWNGYPLVFSDTGTYLSQAPHHYLGWDRPPFYSAFLFALHWKLTTWPAIAAQVLLTAWVIDAARRALVPSATDWSGPLIAALLAFASPLPWVASELMPDLFAGLLVLAMALSVLAGERLARWERRSLAGLCCFSLLAHLGNLPLAGALAILLLLLWRGLFGFWPGRPVRIRIAAPLLAAVLGLSAVNLAGRGVVSVAPYGDVFLLARVLYDGPGMRVLAHDCPVSHWRLCRWRDAMPPTADDFLWNADSPLNRAGGPKVIGPEADAIIRAAALREPGATLEAMGGNALAQLVLFSSGDGLQPWPATVTPWLARDFPGFEQRAYASARQTVGERLPPAWMARLHVAAGLGSIGLCLVLVPWMRRRNPALAGAVLACLGALVLNAAVTGALSGPHARYQSRVMWLPMLMCALGALSLLPGRTPGGAAHRGFGQARPSDTLGAVFWCGIEASASALLSFAGAFLIARMIGASELGVGAAVSSIHVLLWVGANGLLADAIVQRPCLSDAQAGGAVRAGLLFGLAAALAQVAALWPLRAMIGDARLTAMSLVLAAPLPLVGAAGPVQGLLTRRRDYRLLAMRTVLAQASGLAAGAAIALRGGGAWAIIGQQAVFSLSGAAVLLAARPRLSRETEGRDSLRELLRIGLPLTGSTLILHGRYRLFALLVGGIAGPAVLGQVHMAFRLVETLRELASTALWRLLLPAMSERQGDPARLRQAVNGSLRPIALILMPLCALLAAGLRPAVTLLLGPAWTPAALAGVPLALLAGWMFVLFPGGVAVVARGLPYLALRAHAAIAALAAIGVLVLRPSTPIAAALVWVGAHAAVAPYMLATSARALGCSALDTIAAGLPGLALAGLAGALGAVLAGQPGLTGLGATGLGATGLGALGLGTIGVGAAALAALLRLPSWRRLPGSPAKS